MISLHYCGEPAALRYFLSPSASGFHFPDMFLFLAAWPTRQWWARRLFPESKRQKQEMALPRGSPRAIECSKELLATACRGGRVRHERDPFAACSSALLTRLALRNATPCTPGTGRAKGGNE